MFNRPWEANVKLANLMKQLFAVCGTGVVGILLFCFALVMIFGVLAGILALLAGLLMLAWNASAVPMFGAPVLTFWPAFGFLGCCQILRAVLTRSSKSSS